MISILTIFHWGGERVVTSKPAFREATDILSGQAVDFVMSTVFNPFLLAGHPDPFSAFSAIRNEEEVSELSPFGVWSVLSYSECLTVMRNPTLFSSDGRTSNAFVVKQNRTSALQDQGIIALDPPTHTRLRRHLSPTFDV